ncbi:MAG TPA: hypothetical protein VMS56_01015 [Thermoanaerobaculia bacterium]|nr:hypothetical protein [Thermoanaerobaculia bacterium]
MRATLFATLFLALALGGCAQQGDTMAELDLSPEELGEIGARISNEPDRVADILAEAGITEERFEEAIREVTEDPEASRRYAEAFNRGRA